MEENAKPRSLPLAVGLLLGVTCGFLGGLYGAALSTSRGIFNLTEEVVMTAALGRALTGAVFSIGVGLRMKRWGLQLIADVLGSGLVSTLVFYVVARLMKS